MLRRFLGEQDFSRDNKGFHKCICYTHIQNFLYRLRKIMNKKKLLENYCKGDIVVGIEQLNLNFMMLQIKVTMMYFNFPTFLKNFKLNDRSIVPLTEYTIIFYPISWVFACVCTCISVCVHIYTHMHLYIHAHI